MSQTDTACCQNGFSRSPEREAWRAEGDRRRRATTEKQRMPDKVTTRTATGVLPCCNGQTTACSTARAVSLIQRVFGLNPNEPGWGSNVATRRPAAKTWQSFV